MRRPAIACTAALFALLGAPPAAAIPSPELVVGSVTSVSQLVALATALIGGGTFFGLRMHGRNGGGLTRLALALLAGAVALLTISVSLNLYQYVGAKEARQARLEDTLLRPSRLPGGSVNDPDMKELTYGEQLKHPMRISTEEVAGMLAAVARGERDDVMFLDVREAAEGQRKTVPGATFVRFPDFDAAGLDFAGKEAVLFCHNGNRSSETCDALQKRGIKCRFMVGGLEKWVVEGRPIEGHAVTTLKELRALPDYPNRETLLDTADVKRLVSARQAVFVDIRYPTDFAQQHIAGALNLNLRRTPYAELQELIARIPKRPIILPCYDRRGCFFAEVMGYELFKAGYEVLGRYTVPWEYFMARPRPPHVTAWIEENQRSLWTKASGWLAGVLSRASEWTGLAGAILILAFLSRLLVLPVSLKAERDQVRSRALSGELTALKARVRDDPVRRMRALRDFYKDHGLTPSRNLLALAFLPIMALALLGVQQAASSSKGRFLWIADLGGPDPWLIVPLLFAALLAAYLDMAFVRTGRQRALCWILAVPVFTAIAALFNAGAGLYLVASVALLVLQRMLADGTFGRLRLAWAHAQLPRHVVTLDEPDRLAEHGNKAYRLARMRAQGLPVPAGLLLPADAVKELLAASTDLRRAQLDRIWRHLGGRALAVRSCAVAEDGERRSFAGVFESMLDVRRDGLDAAILRVAASFGSERARSYAGSGEAKERGGVLIQQMVAADFAGVMFTRDPAAGGLAMIELTEGTADALVSGAVRAQTYRFGRASGEPQDGRAPPIDLRPLLALGRRIEALFGAPQDVEWAWAHGRFQIVQSRDITTRMPPVQRNLARALDIAARCAPDEIALAKNELCEMLPRPTPLSLSMMEELWASGGSVDLACRRLGLVYPVREDAPDYLVTVLGRLYVNKAEERRRAIDIGRFAAGRLARNADAVERAFREGFLPRLLTGIRLAEVADFAALSTPDLFDAFAEIHARFVTETHVEVDVVNIAAAFHVTRAREALERAGHDPSRCLSGIPATFEARALAEAERVPPGERQALLAAAVGHRAVLDYELSEPRFAENPDSLIEWLSYRAGAPARPGTEGDPTARERKLARMVDCARRFQTLKEDARHHALRELALLRRVVLALDQRLAFGGLIHYLTVRELLSLRGRPHDLMLAVAVERRRKRKALLEQPSAPAALTARDLERISMGGIAIDSESAEPIRGTRVSGSGAVTGRALVVTDADAECGRPLEGFETGDIIVSPMIHPAWLPYFKRAGGLVCEVGSWLSHAAILARECDLTMIVGASGLDAVTNGTRLRLSPDGTVAIESASVEARDECAA